MGSDTYGKPGLQALSHAPSGSSSPPSLSVEQDLVKTLKAVTGVEDVEFVDRVIGEIRANAMVREQSLELTDQIYSAEDNWRDRWPNVRLDLHVRTLAR